MSKLRFCPLDPVIKVALKDINVLIARAINKKALISLAEDVKDTHLKYLNKEFPTSNFKKQLKYFDVNFTKLSKKRLKRQILIMYEIHFRTIQSRNILQ